MEDGKKAATMSAEKQKTAYEIGTGDWSSDVCSSDLYTPNRTKDDHGRRQEGSHDERRKAEGADRKSVV